MKRGRMAFVAIGLVTAMSQVYALPAIAESLIFFPVPDQAGGTYSCGSGPPFVSDPDAAPGEANCSLAQYGQPSGFTCDVPTTIAFVPSDPEVAGFSEYDAAGLLCEQSGGA